MSSTDWLALLVLLPLLGSALVLLVPVAARAWLALAVVLFQGLAWWPLAQTFASGSPVILALGGIEAPLGIRLQLDAPGLLMLLLTALVMLAATLHAMVAGDKASQQPAFWPAWLVLLTGLNVVTLSLDLFNLYVGLELLTLAAVALVATRQSDTALAAAMRYLILAMLASLAWLLGVAMLYGATGTLDMQLLGERLQAGPLVAFALALLLAGLLLKAAIFPLHGWLPLAHASAPGAVSAVLSALVVKVAVLVLWRLYQGPGQAVGMLEAGPVLATLGAGAIVYGSLLAFRQNRLKPVIAYSTVAQLGYLLLVLGMPLSAAWQGAWIHLLAHGLAKAAMFLAAANLLRGLGDDRLTLLAGAGARLPLSAMAIGLAAVSLMGLPPSGGFIGKWLMLQAAFDAGAWHWFAVLLLGSLLAAAYLFRVLAYLLEQPEESPPALKAPVAPLAEWLALSLALLAIVLGFAAAPLLDLAAAGVSGP